MMDLNSTHRKQLKKTPKQLLSVKLETKNCKIAFNFTVHQLQPSPYSAIRAAGYLPRHNQPRGSVGDLEDDPPVACTQLADLLEVVVLQLSHLLLLCQKGLQAFPLLLIQLQLLEFLLQCLQVCSEKDNKDTTQRKMSNSFIINAFFPEYKVRQST